MTKFRSKPVVIDAWLFDGSWQSARPIVQMSNGITWSDHGAGELSIETLEGTMRAMPGDWIIKGTRGEFYPCKPDVFVVKYEQV